MALTDALDHLITDGRIAPQLAMKILGNFDRHVMEVLEAKVKSNMTFKVRFSPLLGVMLGDAGEPYPRLVAIALSELWRLSMLCVGSYLGPSGHVPFLRRSLDFCG